MSSKKRKILLLAVKMVVAGGLLAWVLNQASWNDYVVTKDGKTCSIQSYDAPTKTFLVTQGKLWWRTGASVSEDQLQPIKGTNPPVFVFKGFRESIRDIRWPFIVLAMAGLLASTLIVAVRFWFLLRIQDINIKLWEAIRLTFLGNFFNNFMPSTVGGDLVKAYYVAKHTPRKAAVLVCIFVDRILGMTELTVLAGVMIVTVLVGKLRTFDQIEKSALMVGLVVLIVIGGMTFLLSSRFRRLFHLDKLYKRLPIAHHFEAAGDAARLFRQRFWSLVKAIGITFGAHVVWVGAIASLGMSLTDMSGVPWYLYFINIPLIYIIGAVPVSLGGVGLVEGAFIQFFAGVSPSTVLALALLARFAPMFWSLPGLVVALTGPKLPKAAAMEAELEAAEGREPKSE